MTQQPELNIPLIYLQEASEISFFPATDNQVSLCLVYGLSQDAKVCQDFLEKVFKAVDLDFQNGISKIKLKDLEGFSLSQHESFAAHKIWIGFGIPPEQLGLQFEYQKYVPNTFMEKTFLWADDPAEIMVDPNLKKLLWASLQKLFPKKA